MNGMHSPTARKQPVVSLVMWVLALGAAWILAGWIAVDDIGSLVYAALASVLLVFASAIFKNWRLGLHLFLVWLVFEDLVRKYTGNNMLVYFSKDVLILLIYLSVLVMRKGWKMTFRPRFWLFLSLFFWWGVIQIFNPKSPSILYGLVGSKLYFYYVPLFFVGYALLRNQEDLLRFLLINMALASVIALLGIIQAIEGQGFLNPSILAPEIRQLSTLHRVAPISHVVAYRPNSVFVSDGRFAWFLLLMWILGLGSAAYLVARPRPRNFSILALALTAVAIVLSGSRGALLMASSSALILLAMFLWGTRRLQDLRLMRIVDRTLVGCGLAVFLTTVIYAQAMGARWDFYKETLLPSSPASELAFRTNTYPMQEFSKVFSGDNWVIGGGIGTASLGVQYVSQFLGQGEDRRGVENGYGNLVLEMGIGGLVLWVLWTTTLLLSAWKVVWRLRQTRLFPLAFTILWFAFLLLFPMTYGGMSAYQNFIFNAYLWLLVGILFRLPAIEATAPAPTAPIGKAGTGWAVRR